MTGTVLVSSGNGLALEGAGVAAGFFESAGDWLSPGVAESPLAGLCPTN
jgi:hypothetical protein